MSTALRRSGIYAEYEGATFRANTLGGGRAVLLSDSPVPPPGFDASSGPPWAREVLVVDLDALAAVSTRAQWRGHECEVIALVDAERVMLSDDGRDRAWAEDNMDRREPGVWDTVVPIGELQSVHEESTSLLTHG